MKESGPAVVACLHGISWLSPSQVCVRIPGMTESRLQRMRDEGRGPRYAKPTAKTVVYSLEDVDAYVRSTFVGTRDQS